MLSVRNLVLAAWLSLLACLPTASANAATVATFSFTQAGWIGGTATLTGGFTGTVDSGGFITKDTLTDFHAQLQNGPPGVYTMSIFTAFPSSLFSFNTALPIDSGSLAIYSPVGGSSAFCVGAPAAFGLCGIRGDLDLFGAIGLGAQHFTTQAPVVTLVSMQTPGAPPPTGAPGVPEPATWAIMILGLGAMGQALRGRRKAALAEG